MTGQRDEFRITVTGGREIEITENGARLGKAKIDDAEPLRRKTIEVLRDWLGRWGVLSQHEITDLPVHQTFEVLGEQLYQIIFHNGVGDAFERKYTEAKANDSKLQVTLSFQEEGRELASLPWEFLRRPTREGSEGYFLATHVHLVLSRYIPLEEGPRALPACQLPLKILFVVTIPRKETQWKDERSDLVDTMAGLQDDPNRIQVWTVSDWIGQELNEKLRSRKPHIVHIVGVCKNQDDGIVIALPKPSGGFSWQPQTNLVSVLTEGMPPEDLPRLVVLHLVQSCPDDFTATFDRLAPVLIASGIPAVLAMRYPIPASVAKGFIEKFYQRLARGSRLGEAVQQARTALFAGNGSKDRLFGGPVLYMQSVDEEFVSTTRVSRPEASLISVSADVTHEADRFGGKIVQMKNLVHRVARDDQELMDWFEAISWPQEPAEAERLIRLRIQIDGDIQRRGPIYDAMLFTLEDDPGGGGT